MHIRTIIITVENKPGVMYKISGLLRKRQFNVESLTVSRTQDPHVSRFTITMYADDVVVENVCKQLNKIIEVLSVSAPDDTSLVARELALYKIEYETEKEKEMIKDQCIILGGRAIQETENTIFIEMTGTEDEIDRFYEGMRRSNVREFVRTGRTALLNSN